MGGLSSIGRTTGARDTPILRVGNTRSKRPPLSRNCPEHETARHASCGVCRVPACDGNVGKSTSLHALIRAHMPGAQFDLPTVSALRNPVEVVGCRFVVH